MIRAGSLSDFPVFRELRDGSLGVRISRTATASLLGYGIDISNNMGFKIGIERSQSKFKNRIGTVTRDAGMRT